MQELIVLYIGALISFTTSMMMLKRRPSHVQKYFLMSSIGIFVYMRAAATKRFITQPLAFEWNNGLINQAKLVAMAGLLLGLFEICEVKLTKRQRTIVEIIIVFLHLIFLTAQFHSAYHVVYYMYPHPDGTPGVYLNKGHEGWLYYVAIITEVISVLWIGTFLLIKILKRRGSKTRFLRILIITIMSPVVPWVLGQFGIAGISSRMTDPLTYAALAILMQVLIRRYDIDMTAPVIKEQAIENSRDGIVIADRQKRFRYANKAAETLFPALADENDEAVTKYIAENLAADTVDIDGKTFEIRTDQEYDENNHTQGYLTIIHDISEQVKRIRAEEELKTAVERKKAAVEMSLAADIQRASIPHIFPPYPDRSEFDIFATMEPAREVGGDFYDFFLIDDDHLGLVMADVSGKGIPAALFMMTSKAILQSCAMLGRSPADILAKTNEAICTNNQVEMFVTVWLGIFEISTGKLTAANAGHEYPALKRKDGSFELYKDKHGFAIGLMDGTLYREYEIQLEPGDKLFQYTDGVPEATDAEEEMFSCERMLEALNQDADAGPKTLLNNVREAVSGFVKEAEQFDDLTMMCIEYKGNHPKTEKRIDNDEK